jgi:hypothetical protein
MAFRASLSFILTDQEGRPWHYQSEHHISWKRVWERAVGCLAFVFSSESHACFMAAIHGRKPWSLLNQVSPKALWTWSGLNGRKSE